MAAPAYFYMPFFKSIANKEGNIFTDQLKMMLVDASYTPNINTHQYKSSVTGEISGPAYVAGGVVVGSVTSAVSGGVWAFDAVDASWGPNATITDARYGILYYATPGSDAARFLIGYVDFLVDTSCTNSTFTVMFDASGVGAVTAA